MRRGTLDGWVRDVVRVTLAGDDEDVAAVVLEDEKFGVLSWTLDDIAGGDQDEIEVVFDKAVLGLSVSEKDWLVGDTEYGGYAEHPATYLAAKAREVS